MLPANRHFLPVIGIDIHIVLIAGVPVPVPHPYIGLVFDIADYIPFIGSTININGVPRGNTPVTGMLVTKNHIPLGGPFALLPFIGHNSVNFFGSLTVKAQDALLSTTGYMVMTCNDIGLPLTASPGKKMLPFPNLYLPTSTVIHLPMGNPVMVGGPYVPDWTSMARTLMMSYGLGGLLKGLGKGLNRLSRRFKCTQGLSKTLCKLGFEPVDLVTGRVIYEGTDFELPGPLPVKWERSWYSDSGYEGLMGHGMHCCYDMTLSAATSAASGESGSEDQEMMALVLPDGRETAFALLHNDGDSDYNRPEKLTLTRKGDGYELVDHNNQLTYHFELVEIPDECEGALNNALPYKSATQRPPDAYPSAGSIKKIMAQQCAPKNFKPVSLTNTAGFCLRFFYNKAGVLEKMTDTAGRDILLTLDGNRVTEIHAVHRGAKRLLVSYGYNEHNDLSEITDALGKTTRIVYQNHLMVHKTDRNGQSFYWTYDGLSTGARCIHTRGDGGLLEGRIAYHDGYNEVTNSLGETTVYHYDERNLCTSVTDPMGGVVEYVYTSDMELYREVDEEGDITGYTYDKRGNIKSKDLPDGSSITWLYNDFDRVKLKLDAESHTTVYTYYDNRQLRSVTAADNSVTYFRYNEAGLVASVNNENNELTQFSYDEDFNLTKVIQPNGTEASWQYDLWGRCTQVTNPENASQRYWYDELNRVVAIRQFDQNKVELEYDAYEEVVFAKDRYHKVKFDYNPLGSLMKREENGTKITFSYDTENRLTALRNEQNEAYRFEYNPRGEVATETGFDGISRSYLRDRAGKVIRTERPGNKWSEHEYDNAGRLVRTEHADESWETYYYNRNGLLVQAENEHSTVKITRDRMGRVVGETQGEHRVTGRYNEMGQRTGITSSLGADISQQYDKAGMVSRIKARHQRLNATEQATPEYPGWEAEITYNNLGLELERLMPGGISNVRRYDMAGRPVKHTVAKGGRETLQRSYQWNVNDRLQRMTDGITNGITDYGHDDFGNLAWAQYENGLFDYKLPDSAGNLYRTKDKKDRKYGPGGKLLEANGTVYSYDDEGNLVSKKEKDGKEWKYTWKGNGMLALVVRPDQKAVKFEYDALGRRTAKIFNGTVTRWLWNGNVPLHEWCYPHNERPIPQVNEWGEVSCDPEPVKDMTTWVFDEGSFRPAAKLKGDQTYSIITDYLGTPIEMYDAKGERTWAADYDIYGKIRKQHVGKAFDCPFRYQGQYEDTETGLYYNRFRYYSPDEGMYISQDPIGLAGGMVAYGYVRDVNVGVDVWGLVDIWFRALNQQDITTINNGNGIIPKNPSATNTPLEHVLHGSTKGYRDQFISLSKDRGFAENWAIRSGTEVTEIDIDKVSGKKYDLTTSQGRLTYLGDAKLGDPDILRANKLAKGAKEILVEGDIPKDAIVNKYRPKCK